MSECAINYIALQRKPAPLPSKSDSIFIWIYTWCTAYLWSLAESMVRRIDSLHFPNALCCQPVGHTYVQWAPSILSTFRRNSATLWTLLHWFTACQTTGSQQEDQQDLKWLSVCTCTTGSDLTWRRSSSYWSISSSSHACKAATCHMSQSEIHILRINESWLWICQTSSVQQKEGHNVQKEPLISYVPCLPTWHVITNVFKLWKGGAS